jgi:hypothetical protein
MNRIDSDKSDKTNKKNIENELCNTSHLVSVKNIIEKFESKSNDLPYHEESVIVMNDNVIDTKDTNNSTNKKSVTNNPNMAKFQNLNRFFGGKKFF